MRNWTNFALSAGLLTLACACGGSGDDGEPGGGGTTGGTGPGTGTGTGSGGLACSVVERGLPVSGSSGSQPAIHWTGDGYAVAWTDVSGVDTDIRLALLTPDGAVQADTEIAG
ncbi:MAG TPA: hypothetical protein VLS89_06510, partial [Candidatus Nanopelagicales bacterium]|nr:hypothetical protein [Candidatus Nanopelagicales bacterium]